MKKLIKIFAMTMLLLIAISAFVGCDAIFGRLSCSSGNHSWNDGEVTKEASCNEVGEKTFTCTNCSETRTEEIGKTAHTLADAVRENEVAATCAAAGSYDEVVKCSACNTEISRKTKSIDKLTTHTAGTPVRENEVAATCKDAGSYDEVVYCSVCGTHEISRESKTIEKLTTHTPAEAVRENDIPATADADGSYDSVVYCSVCNAELSRETITVERHHHTAGDAVRENEVAATCKDAGSYDMVVYCTDCKSEMSRTTHTIEKLTTHTAGTPVRENEVAATCKDAGSYDEVVYCSVCDKELSRETKSIDKLTTHTAGDGVKENEIAPAHNVAGSYDEVVYCSVCHTELSRETKSIPALPSTLSQWNAHNDDRSGLTGSITTDWTLSAGGFITSPDNWGNPAAVKPDTDGAYLYNTVTVPADATIFKMAFNGWVTYQLCIKGANDTDYVEFVNGYYTNYFTVVKTDLSAYAGQVVEMKIVCSQIVAFGFTDRADCSTGVSTYDSWNTNADILCDWNITTGTMSYADGVNIGGGAITNVITVPADKSALKLNISPNWKFSKIDVSVNGKLVYDDLDPIVSSEIDLSAYAGQTVTISIAQVPGWSTDERTTIASIEWKEVSVRILETPTATLDGNTKLTWTAVDGASSYIVYVNSTEIPVEGTELTFATPLVHGDKVCVQAIGDGVKYVNSSKSEELAYYSVPLTQWNAHNDDRSGLTGSITTDWTLSAGSWTTTPDNWGNPAAVKPDTDGAYLYKTLTVPTDAPIFKMAFNGWVTYQLYIKGANDTDYVEFVNGYYTNMFTVVATDLSSYAGQVVEMKIVCSQIVAFGFTDRADCSTGASTYDSWNTNADILCDWNITTGTMSYADGVNIGGGSITNMLTVSADAPILKLALGVNWKFSKLDVIINDVVVFDDIDPITTNTFDLSAYAGQTVKITLAQVAGWSTDERPGIAAITWEAPAAE